MLYSLPKSHIGSQQMFLSIISFSTAFGVKLKWSQRVLTNKFLFQVTDLAVFP